ncbi:hypothetical protein K493DRAFT_224545, partial [Basidiobolus meristosporus CBS 931.73]
VCSIIEGRGIASEIGMCLFNFKTSECLISQFADSQTYAKVLYRFNLYPPEEILMSSTAIDPAKSKLYSTIEEHNTYADILTTERKNFSDISGIAYIKQLSLPEDTINLLLCVSSKYYCLAATAALLKYIENSRDIFFTPQSIRFKYETCESLIYSDALTARNLELVTNILNSKNNNSLYGTLNHTSTPMGARMLKINVLQPLFALKNFPDVDYLISSMVKIPRKISTKCSEQGITNILLSKHILKVIKPLKTALEPGKNSLFTTVLKILSDTKLAFLEERINLVINEDISFQKNTLAMRNYRCYAVKAGFNGLLDVARQTYKEATNDVYELVNNYKEKYGIELKINFSHSMGFFLSVQGDQLPENELPSIFINVTRKKKLLVFTSMELLKWNERISNSLTEVYLMSDKIITELTNEICTHISILYKVAESIALVDMMMSFAYLCTISNYVRPEFTNTLGIKKGRHPIQDSLSLTETVSNDCYAAEGKSFQIVTGPNMSGKSTYLKQIALLTIMAHMGSFIPAEYASVRLTDKLFSRICNDGFMQTNMSSFMSEMTEMNYIIRNVTDHSLVIIDELGRGTSTYDGLGISYAISESLLSTSAFVFFATHFQELAIGLDIYPNVVNLNLAVQVMGIQFNSSSFL